MGNDARDAKATKMKITDSAEIAQLIKNFSPSTDGAYATCRVLEGQYAQANQQEWAERGTLNGEAATVYYIFANSEAVVEDGADMSFDVAHIDRIEMEDAE